MKYALLVHQSQEYFDRRDNATAIAAGKAYGEALQAAGVLVGGAGLESPQAATTVSVRNGKRQVHDGPYAETKEFLAGIGIIDVPDLDAALEWAARHPGRRIRVGRSPSVVRIALCCGIDETFIMSESATHAAIEAIARNSYGRLDRLHRCALGRCRRGGRRARATPSLRRWSDGRRDGVPQKPEAWLLHAARNRVIDAARRHQVRQNAETFSGKLQRKRRLWQIRPSQFPDERLKLLFVCAHPAIDAAARTPLMLQTVLGVEAAPNCVCFSRFSRRDEPAPRSRKEQNSRCGYSLPCSRTAGVERARCLCS